MKNLIKSVKCEVCKGVACGPIFGPVVAEVELVGQSGKTRFFSLSEFEGMPAFYKSEESLYKYMVDQEITNEEASMLNSKSLEFESYEDLIESEDVIEDRNVLNYLMYVVRSDEKATNKFIENTVNKYIEDIEIPEIDI